MKLILIILLFSNLSVYAQFPFSFWAGSEESESVELLTNYKSLNLDGTTEYATVNDDNSLSFDSLSFAAWVYMVDATNFTILFKSNEYEFSTDASDKLTLTLEDGATSGYLKRLYNTTLTTYENQWIHVACSFDGTDIFLFLNGVEVSDLDNNSGVFTNMSNSANPLIIGYNGTNYADGNMDQCLIFNEPLNVKKTKESIVLRDQNYNSITPVIWWDWEDIDTITGSTISDKIGSNTATLQNSPVRTFCVPFPYEYQLDDLNNTPFQNSDSDPFGGFSFDFNGVNNKIEVSDSDDLTSQTLSGSAWINADDLTNFPIINKKDELLFWVNTSDKLEVRFIDSTTGGYIGRIYNTALTFEVQKQTILVGFTKNGTDIDLYINDSIVDDTDANSGSFTEIRNTINPLTIGFNGSDYADGTIADIALYNTETVTDWNGHEPEDLSNTLAYYRAYESTIDTILDQSGSGLNGVFYNASSQDVTYNYPLEIFESDSSGSFYGNGVNEKIEIADNDNLSFGDGTTDQPFSISVWLKGGDTNHKGLLSKVGNAIYKGEYHFSILGGETLYFVLYDEGANARIGIYNTSSISTTSGWKHYLATYDGSGSNLGMNTYINAEIWGNTRFTGGGAYVAMENQDDPVNIGYIDRGLNHYTNGNLSHVTIIKKELSQCEINELYNKGSPIDIEQSTFSTDIISHWRLNQGDTTTTNGVIDIIGTNHGTPVNMDSTNINLLSYPTN